MMVQDGLSSKKGQECAPGVVRIESSRARQKFSADDGLIRCDDIDDEDEEKQL